MYDKWNVCVWGCLFRIWLTLIDFFIECKCLSHIMITTTIQRSWMKQKTETAFFCIASKPASHHLFIYLNIRTATQQNDLFENVKCDVVALIFFKIRKFQIHIVRFALSAFCGMRWMNQHTWLDMIAVIDWLESFELTIRTKLCHPFRNGTFCLRHYRSTTTNNLIEFPLLNL